MKGVWEDVAWSREGHKSLLQLCGQGSSFSPSLHRGFAILANPQKHFLCWRTAPALGLVRAAELLLCLLVIYVPPLLFMIWYLEVPAGLTVQVTSPRDCPGSPRHQPSSPQAHWQGWNLYKAFYDAVCTEVSFCELEDLLGQLSKTSSVSFQLCSVLGVCFVWDSLVCWPWHTPYVHLLKPHSPFHPWKILQQHKFHPCGFFWDVIYAQLSRSC